jgi:hypothetical protein
VIPIRAWHWALGIFGGDLTITRRGDVDPTATESEKDLVINAALDNGAFILRASDRADATSDVQTRIELTINGNEETDLRRIFDALSDGGASRLIWRRCSGATSSALSSTGSVSGGRSTSRRAEQNGLQYTIERTTHPRTEEDTL